MVGCMYGFLLGPKNWELHLFQGAPSFLFVWCDHSHLRPARALLHYRLVAQSSLFNCTPATISQRRYSSLANWTGSILQIITFPRSVVNDKACGIGGAGSSRSGCAGVGWLRRGRLVCHHRVVLSSPLGGVVLDAISKLVGLAPA